MERPGRRLCLASLWVVACAAVAQPAEDCAAEPALHVLDFWLGDWDVTVEGHPAGTDRVERILRGCAIQETWHDVDGSEGRGIFWFEPTDRTLQQVWLTDQALRPGGRKNKHLVARFADAAARFQGEIPLPDGSRVMDRTTLGPRSDGSVSQRIEISRDGGQTWILRFDAIYRHPPASRSSPAP